MKPSEIIMTILIGLLIIFTIMNKMRSNKLVHDGKYNHIVECTKQNPLDAMKVIRANNIWIEADTVDDTIHYRIYWSETQRSRTEITKHQ
jgi:hypothetical protein